MSVDGSSPPVPPPLPPSVFDAPAFLPGESFWVILASAGMRTDETGDIITIGSLRSAVRTFEPVPFLDENGNQIGTVQEVILDESAGTLQGLVVMKE